MDHIHHILKIYGHTWFIFDYRRLGGLPQPGNCFALLACMHARTHARTHTQHSTVDLAVSICPVGLSVCPSVRFLCFSCFLEVFPHECLYAGLGRALLVWASEILLGEGEKLTPLSRNRRVCVCEGSVCRKGSSMLTLTRAKNDECIAQNAPPIFSLKF